MVGKSKEEQLDDFVISSLQHAFNVTLSVGNVCGECISKMFCK